MLRILIVDDSRLMRAAVREALSAYPELQIVGEAEDGQRALSLIIVERPDLVIMDVEMPGLDGLGVLRELRDRGIRVGVIMLSSLTQTGTETTIRALELGALDFVPKPAAGSDTTPEEAALRLVSRVRELAEVQRLKPPTRLLRPIARKKAPGEAGLPAIKAKREVGPPRRLLIIGASTGGPHALTQIFAGLSKDFSVPIVIIQHMPEVFTATFADRLSLVGPIAVSEAGDGQTLVPGKALVAPGDRHLTFRESSGGIVVRLDSTEKVNGHRPSIDVSLLSAAGLVGSGTAALLLTGMGRDGATGMLATRKAGGLTMAQDEHSSVVYGMNKRAIEEGGAASVLALGEIAAELNLIFGGAARP